MHVYKINICLSFFLLYISNLSPSYFRFWQEQKHNKQNDENKLSVIYIYIFKIHVLEIKEITPQQMALITETRLLDVMAYAIATGKTALFHNVNTHVNNSLKSSN